MKFSTQLTIDAEYDGARGWNVKLGSWVRQGVADADLSQLVGASAARLLIDQRDEAATSVRSSA
jgi:hypothetical protein